MLAYLNDEECELVYSYVTENAYQNMHTRGIRQINKKRTMKHLNAMKLEGGGLTCYLCGPGIEIVYKVNRRGAVTITDSTLTVDKAYEYLKKVKKDVVQRARAGDGTYNPKRTPGEYYLKRAHRDRPGESAGSAVLSGQLTSNFVNTVYRWGFEVMRGKE
jgi:uncharacterized protein (UPF0212 family)